MRDSGKITLLHVLAVISLTVLVVMLVLPAFNSGHPMPNRAVCMSYLSSINKALVLYRSANDDQYPWLYDTTPGWETTKVGTNRSVSPHGPNDDPNNPKARSITALMFLLVRSDQSPGIFRCPGDKDSIIDDNVKAGADDGDILKGEYYWDFSKPENVSYSWQAPMSNAGRFKQGIAGNDEPHMVILADMTPRYGGNQPWKPMPLDDDTSRADIKKQLSHNHAGKQVNLLRVAGNVKAVKRPDVGIGKDNIYTTFGADFSKRRAATSTKLSDHVHKRDTFLIGPVGR